VDLADDVIDAERGDAERISRRDVDHDRAGGEDLAGGGRSPGDDGPERVVVLGRLGAEELIVGVVGERGGPGEDVLGAEAGAVGGRAEPGDGGVGQAPAQARGVDRAARVAARPFGGAAGRQQARRADAQHLECRCHPDRASALVASLTS
jgi:hypothetical protein